MTDLLAYLAAATVALWGVAHTIPTRQVVAAFEPTATDNHRVIVQEWLVEAVAMWGLAGLVITITAAGGDGDLIDTVYQIVAGMLIAIAAVTALTGARTRVLWFKVCPVLLVSTAALLLIASAI